MDPQGQNGQPGGGPTERRWSWPKAAVFIIICSILGWLLIAGLLKIVLH